MSEELKFVYQLEIRGWSTVDTHNYWTDKVVYDYEISLSGQEALEFLAMAKSDNIFPNLDESMPYQLYVKKYPINSKGV